MFKVGETNLIQSEAAVCAQEVGFMQFSFLYSHTHSPFYIHVFPSPILLSVFLYSLEISTTLNLVAGATVCGSAGGKDLLVGQ